MFYISWSVGGEMPVGVSKKCDGRLCFELNGVCSAGSICNDSKGRSIRRDVHMGREANMLQRCVLDGLIKSWQLTCTNAVSSSFIFDKKTTGCHKVKSASFSRCGLTDVTYGGRDTIATP
ncbi:hypothetical protein QQ045_023639 [Rhodiola kirilowii]